MSGDDCCDNCLFSQFRLAERIGQCRRYPPIPLSFGLRENPIVGSNPVPQVDSFYAGTIRDWWCGEHKRKAEPARETILGKRLELDERSLIDGDTETKGSA